MRATSVADSMRSEEKEQLRGLLAAVESEGADSLLLRLEGEMLEAARALEFERAASLRDRIDEVRSTLATAGVLGVGTTDAPAPPRGTGRGQTRRGTHRGGRR
jgi:excinuclease UvrABC nuclease subunit